MNDLHLKGNYFLVSRISKYGIAMVGLSKYVYFVGSPALLNLVETGLISS